MRDQPGKTAVTGRIPFLALTTVSSATPLPLLSRAHLDVLEPGLLERRDEQAVQMLPAVGPAIK
jgi:hypothetical protein